MYSRIVLLVLTFLMSSTAFSQGMNIQFASKTARFMYLTEAFGQDFGRLELEAGVLYNENSDFLLNMGLLVRGESVSMPMIVSVGARVYYADVGPYNVGAIAIGGDLLLAPESWGGVGLGVNFYTAPGVVAFGDADDLTEYGIYLNYQITPQASFSLGYKNIDTEIKNVGSITIDEGGYFGLSIEF